MPTRRQFIKASAVSGAALYFNVLGGWGSAFAAPAAAGLSDPALQPKFANLVPNALHPSFRFRGRKRNRVHVVDVLPGTATTGLVGPGGTPVATPIFGYGQRGVATWPGKTFEIEADSGPVEVTWRNKLVDGSGTPVDHLLDVDTSLHWAYSLHGYEDYTISSDGVPIVVHLHGGHTDAIYDGNPEYFFSPDWQVRGPRWVDQTYTYRNDQPAGTLWYHDHALGITRLNVYAGMAGFWILRDGNDTGRPNNAFDLPAFPHELAYAIQDRMFHEDGQLFYPAFPGDPFYDDFITGEGAVLPPDLFPGGGPTALAEFFGDHMVVNGKIWPKQDVEPRHYRMRLLNGTDSRFLVIRLRAASSPSATDLMGASEPLDFTVIGSDQGLASSPTTVDALVIEPGGRYDVVVDFTGLDGQRVIMENIGGDAPFGGDFGDALAEEDVFPDRQTDRIMAFDVSVPLDTAVPDMFDAGAVVLAAPTLGTASSDTATTRGVALFEGMDEFGRLQPLLGTAEPVRDSAGDEVSGAIAWHSPTTENPQVGDTEIWEIYNATGDAHPVHLHLVHFEVLDRREFTADVVSQPIEQHNGATGAGFRLENISVGAVVELGPDDGYVENAPKDMVTALPEQVTRIRATFDLPGRYVWHCHILSHEDHEMMRVLHVGPVPEGE